MLLETPSFRGVVYLDGEEIEWDNNKLDLSDRKAKKLLSLPGYNIAVRHPEPYSRAKKILINRGSGMGDVLMALRVVKEIKQKVAPNAELDFTCSGEFSMLGKGFEYAKVIGYGDIPNDAADRYNKIVKLNQTEFNGLSGILHRIDVFAHFAKIPQPLEDKHLFYRVTKKEKIWAKQFIKDEDIVRPIAIVAVSANCANRMFGHMDNWCILKGLIERGVFPIIVDKDPHKVFGGIVKDNSIHYTGQSLRRVAALIDAADIVVTPDTGIMHLASALDKWTIAYFGAIDWKLRKTHERLIPLYSKTIACYPCHGYNCENPLCLRDVGVQRVVKAATHCLKSKLGYRLG